jgi:hypothetical protein
MYADMRQHAADTTEQAQVQAQANAEAEAEVEAELEAAAASEPEEVTVEARADRRQSPPAADRLDTRLGLNLASLTTSGVDRPLFDRIKHRRYHPAVGFYASWAVWADDGKDDLDILDPDLHPTLLQKLRNDVIMVGLNPSAMIPKPLNNFHGAPWGPGQKLRHAFTQRETPDYCGAYMTDFITTRAEPDSKEVMRNLTRDELRENADRFIAELNDLGCERPTILTFGVDSHRLVHDSVPSVRCRCPIHGDPDGANKRLLIPLPHYADRRYNSLEKYVKEVRRRLILYGGQRV